MDSLIGNVPENWAQARLAEVCDILAGPSGARLRLETRTSSNVPVVTPKDLRNNRIDENGGAAAAVELANELARYRLAPGDVVCARTGELGRQALAGKGQEGWLFGTACLRLRVRDRVRPDYLVYYLAHPAVRSWIMRNDTGSAIPSLSTKTLGSMLMVIPPSSVQSAVADVLCALDEKIAIHHQISRTTAALRDAVLPRLLDGSLRE
jgi:type I restriction enzyme, S subunit